MCSHFLKSMDNYQGDLADIVRASGGSIDGGYTAPADVDVIPNWQFQGNRFNYSSDPSEDFGDPFTYIRDPLFQNMDTQVSGFFNNSNIIKSSTVEDADHKILDDEMKRPSNIFSRMLQISPNAKLAAPPCKAAAAAAAAVGSPTVLKGSPMLVPSNHSLISSSSSKGCLVESPGLQISSPGNTGIKRRKTQAKKVVCIPAPAPANSRASGEIVPSDLWAWRKYGQKPIKGSPYPRGYYRCSSSKGCSARKQVERSRTDPNMLVITYTSEHNHPWPTQRNALAGSTRSQPSKTANTTSKTSPNSQAQKPTNPKQDQNEISTENTVTSSSTNSAAVKEETDLDFDHNPLANIDDTEFDEGLPQSYKPTLPGSNHSEDSFFADLGEIEGDPLDLLFTQGFSGDDGRVNKDLDSFGFYDWATNNCNITSIGGGCGGGSAATYGEGDRGS